MKSFEDLTAELKVVRVVKAPGLLNVPAVECGAEKGLGQILRELDNSSKLSGGKERL